MLKYRIFLCLSHLNCLNSPGLRIDLDIMNQTSAFFFILDNLQAAVHLIVCSGITGHFDGTSLPIYDLLD